MGEAKRRYGKIRIPSSPEEARAMDGLIGVPCGWRGCEADFIGDRPPGWVNLLVYDAPAERSARHVQIEGRVHLVLDYEQRYWRHDKMLCPKHARALDRMLLNVPDDELEDVEISPPGRA